MTPRQLLAAAQEDLVRSLVAGGTPPSGFDPGRIAEQARALHNKRRRGIERVAPDVVAALGENFPATFAAWARDNPPRTDSCTRADAAAFAAWALPAGEVRTSRRRWRSARRAGARPAPG